MGGNAAKERRRLKRLSENVGAIEGDNSHLYMNQKSPLSVGPSLSKKTKLQRNNNDDLSKLKVPTLLSKESSSHRSKSTPKKKNNLGHKSTDKVPVKSNKLTITKTKSKKPKHLARKMQLAQDPEVRQDLEQKQNALNLKKEERTKKFRDKVMSLVGGAEYFDDVAFQKIMNKGGGKLERIVEVSKKLSSYKHNHESLISVTNEDENCGTSQSSENNSNTTASSSPSSDDDQDNKTNLGPIDTKEGSNIKTSASSSESPYSDSTSSSDSESSNNETMDMKSEKRSRGRRRRGLKEVDKKREAMNVEQQHKLEQSSLQQEDNQFKPQNETEAHDKRRCVGRKPVTDFQVGKKYSGTIQYIKPNLGLFIDIGCHSDAFCHISRASDGYIDALESIFHKGDVLTDKVRVVDVDRKSKRITVSLQSDMKIADEEKSQREYNQRRHAKEEKNQNVAKYKMKSPIHHDRNDKHHTLNPEKDGLDVSKPKWKQEEGAPIVIDPETMTPAEIKRARKLLRRQERRAVGV